MHLPAEVAAWYFCMSVMSAVVTALQASLTFAARATGGSFLLRSPTVAESVCAMVELRFEMDEAIALVVLLRFCVQRLGRVSSGFHGTERFSW